MTTPTGFWPRGLSSNLALPFRSLLWVLLCAGVLLSLPLTPAPGLAGGPAADSCSILDREKWLWQSWFEDDLPPFFENPDARVLPAAFGTCWACGLWADQDWPPSWNPPRLRNAITFRKAGCARLLDMQQAALEAYRTLLHRDAAGERAGASISAVVEILVRDGNLEPALYFYERLDPAQQEMASPETLYLLGHSCYVLGQDERAAAFLRRVPARAGVYPLARYTQVQIAFRSGDPDQAVAELRRLTRSGPEDPIPEVLRERAQLTLARMLFQQAHYQEAADAFRSLSRSRTFLPEALLGMGWCYEAMDRPAGAIAFFQAADEAASRDLLLQSKARMEMARLYAESGMHEEAFRAFRQTQDRIREYLAFLTGLTSDPDRMSRQAQLWLEPEVDAVTPEEPRGHGSRDASSGRAAATGSDPARASSPPLSAAISPEAGTFQKEIDATLRKAGYLSPRMQQINEVRDTLASVQSLLDEPPAPPRAPRTKRGIPTLPTPALDVREDRLPPETVHLLDVTFALLDTEYRLIRTTGLLELSSPQARSNALEDTLNAYRALLQALVAASPGDSLQATAADLPRLMSVVRHLPCSREDRETILKKLVHTQQALRDGEETLQQWTQAMKEAGPADAVPPRPLLLRFWMVYVRSLIDLRTWQDRSPAAFLVPVITTGHTGDPQPPARLDGMRDLLADRMAACWTELEAAVQEEILRICARRMATLEELLMDSELYYAEALLKHQESLLQELQSLPDEPEEERGPEDGPGEGSFTPSASGT